MITPCNLVIGGTRGLGRELAEYWQRAGADVHIVGRQSPGTELVPGPRFWPVDLARKTEVAAFCADFKAAHSTISRLVFAQRCARPESIEEEMQVCVYATIQIIEGLRECLSSETGATVLLVGSLAARQISVRQGVGYHVAKAALLQVGRYFACQLGPANVRVNVLSPSYFLKAHQAHPPPALQPLERLGALPGSLRSEAIIPWIDFLTGAASSGMTGQVVELDHGANLLDPESKLLGATPSS